VRSGGSRGSAVDSKRLARRFQEYVRSVATSRTIVSPPPDEGARDVPMGGDEAEEDDPEDLEDD
jgi:hypothetical protein